MKTLLMILCFVALLQPIQAQNSRRIDRLIQKELNSEQGRKFWICNNRGKMEMFVVPNSVLPAFLYSKNLEYLNDIPTFFSSVYAEVGTRELYVYTETGKVYFKDNGKTKFRRTK